MSTASKQPGAIRSRNWPTPDQQEVKRRTLAGVGQAQFGQALAGRRQLHIDHFVEHLLVTAHHPAWISRWAPTAATDTDAITLATSAGAQKAGSVLSLNRRAQLFTTAVVVSSTAQPKARATASVPELGGVSHTRESPLDGLANQQNQPAQAPGEN